jgi:DNA repair protein RecO (recombination protein O)
LLTEAQVIQRFPRLRTDLAALYAAYYVAELLADWTQEYDPHPLLFDEALDTLRTLGTGNEEARSIEIGPRIARFEMVLLRELGYSPVLDHCAACGGSLVETELAFSCASSGVLCRGCRIGQRDSQPLSARTWRTLKDLADPGAAWIRPWGPEVRAEVRQLLGQYVTHLLGRRPRLLPYLGS